MKVRTSVLRGFALLALSSLAFTACDEKAVTPEPEVEVVVTPSSATLEVGQTTSFIAVVRNADSQNVTWASSNTSVATVNSSTGVVTAVAPGNATITATSTEDASARAAAQVIVVAAPPPPAIVVAVVPSQASMVEGQTLQLVPVVTNATNTAVTYTSLDQSVATVSATGLVTAVDPGTAVIRVSSVQDPTKFANAVITVTAAPPPPVISVTITPTQATGQVGQQVGFSAVVNNSTNQAVNWTSSVPAVATVDANGVATLLTAGSTVIRATSAADPTKSASATLTVTAPQTDPVVVTIVPSQVTLAPGQTQAFAASSSASGDVLTYSSSNTAVVTVDANTGVATAVAQGSAVITARSTVDPNRTAQAIVTVTSAPPITITVNPTQISALGTGASTQIIATISGSDNQNVTCSTADANVATVTTTADGRGCVVTGVASGSTVITVASAADPTRVQTVPVTVVGASVAIANIPASPAAGAFTINTNVSVPAGTADSLMITLRNAATGTEYTVRCQTFTAAGAATTVACPINPADIDPNTAGAQVLPNGTYTVIAELIRDNEVAATATFGTQLTTANNNTVAGVVTFNNQTDDTDNNPDNAQDVDLAGNAWWGGDATVTLTPSIFQGNSIATIQVWADVACDGANAATEAVQSVTIGADGSGTVTFDEQQLQNPAAGLDGIDDVEAAVVCFRISNARDAQGAQVALAANGGTGNVVTAGQATTTQPGANQSSFSLDNVQPAAFVPTLPATVLANNNYAGLNTTFSTATVGGLAGAVDGGVGRVTFTFYAVPSGAITTGTQANLQASTTTAGAMAITSASQLPESTVANNAYALVVEAVDALGNVQYGNAGTFGVDLTVPTVTANAATSAGDNSTNPANNQVDLRIEDTFSGPRVVRTRMTFVNVFEGDTNTDVDTYCVTDNAGTVAVVGASGVCPTFDVAVNDVPGVTEQAMINLPAASGEAYPAVDGTPDEGYFTIEIRSVDRAGNVSEDVVTRTVLLDQSNPGGTIDMFTVVTATNSITLNGTLRDDVEVESHDVRYNFPGLGVVPDQIPFTDPTVENTYGLPLASSDANISVTGANAVNIREVNGIAPNAVGFGVWDIAGNFAFVNQPMAFGGGNGTGLTQAEYETAGINQFDLDVATSGSASENAIVLDRSSGPTTTNLRAVVEVGPTDQNPISRVYFYFVHPGSDGAYGGGDDYLVLIDDQTSSSVITGVTERTFTFVMPVNATVGGTFPMDSFTYNVVALAVDAQGDAILSDLPTVRIQP